MKEFIWGAIAKAVSLPAVSAYLVARAKKTPYLHIVSPDCSEVYMERYWLANPYDRTTNKARWAPWFPWSIRIHHIRREDRDRDCHDHPWNARTIILQGGYVEKRLGEDGGVTVHLRPAGSTAKLNFGEYHQITHVKPEGAVTLFITGPYRGTWGFLVDGVKVQWRKYLGLDDGQDLPDVKPKQP